MTVPKSNCMHVYIQKSVWPVNTKDLNIHFAALLFSFLSDSGYLHAYLLA